MRTGFLATALLAGALALAGCATPHLDIAEPDDRQKAEAVAVLAHAEVSPARNLPAERMEPTVGRILERVRSASHSVCTKLEMPDERCQPILTNKVTVHTQEKDINAFADGNDNVSLLGGLVGGMGADAEIAGVLAHEYAHVMLGHVGKKRTNALVGGLLLGLLTVGATAGAGSESKNERQKLVRDMTRLGWQVGAAAYSPAMEIEADRTAVYILHEAGLPPAALQSALVRMSRARTGRTSGTFSGTVGFLETHPSDNRRLAHLISAMEDVRAGKPLKPAKGK